MDMIKEKEMTALILYPDNGGNLCKSQSLFRFKLQLLLAIQVLRLRPVGVVKFAPVPSRII
jgi:hypothetical protein